MKININLQEDKELRNEVKNMISGQVKKIIKEDIKDLINKEVMPKEKLVRLYRDELINSIKSKVRKFSLDPTFTEEIIKPYAIEIIKRSIKKVNVDLLVQGIIKNILHERIEKFHVK